MSTHERRRTQLAYDAVAADYDRLLPGLDAEARLDVAMIDDFADRCGRARLGRVVDVGCGAGRMSAYLADRGLDVMGVDLSPGMISLARRSHPGLHFAVGTSHQLPVQSGTLGGLFAWYSLIHDAPDLLAPIIAEFARVLRPGGWLLTAFQAGDGQRIDRSSAYGRSVTMTNYRHDADRVSELLEDHGFRTHARLSRAAEGTEKSPQSILLAQRSSRR